MVQPAVFNMERLPIFEFYQPLLCKGGDNV